MRPASPSLKKRQAFRNLISEPTTLRRYLEASGEGFVCDGYLTGRSIANILMTRKSNKKSSEEIFQLGLAVTKIMRDNLSSTLCVISSHVKARFTKGFLRHITT